jgi:hypothetical protein
MENGNGKPLARVNAREGGIEIRDIAELQRFCKMAVHANIFKSATDLAKACMIAQYGMELGISPVTSLCNMHMVEGKITMGATLVAGLIKKNGKYTYRVSKADRDGCEIVFMEKGVGELGPASFDREDAILAGLAGKHNWKKYPKAMYYARALTQGARMYCADMFLGNAAYTPEEMTDGELVDDAFAAAWGMEDHQNTSQKSVFSAADSLKEEFLRDSRVHADGTGGSSESD